MNRQDAHELIRSGWLTWGDLKTALRCEMGGPARIATVNKGMTHEQAIDILAKAIEGREDAEVVASKWGRERSDTLMATNILRECREYRPQAKTVNASVSVETTAASEGKETKSVTRLPGHGSSEGRQHAETATGDK